jgi:hypothetical protein
LGASFRLPYQSRSRSISVATEILILHFVVHEAAGNDGAPLPARPWSVEDIGAAFIVSDSAGQKPLSE